MLGAPSHDQQPNTLNEEGQAALAFVRASVHELSTATLVSYTFQVVAGSRFGFTFEGYEGVVYVWSQPWNNNFL